MMLKMGLDTYGLSLNGMADVGEQTISYKLEYATQDSDSATDSYSADYLAAELGTSFSGITIKAGYELLDQMMVCLVFLHP